MAYTPAVDLEKAFRSQAIGGEELPDIKIVWGADGVATRVAVGAAALPIQDGGNSITVDGAVSVAGPVALSGPVTVEPGASPLAVGGAVSLAGAAEAGLAAIADAVDQVANPSVMRVTGDVTVPGTVTVADGGGSITVDGAVSLAGTADVRIVETLASGPQIDYAVIGGVAYPINRAAVSLSADGNLVAAGGVGNRILVHGLFLQSSVAQATCQIKDGSTGAVLCYAQPGANGGFVLPESPMGWIKGTANTPLYLDSFGAAGTVTALVVYTLIP